MIIPKFIYPLISKQYQRRVCNKEEILEERSSIDFITKYNNVLYYQCWFVVYYEKPLYYPVFFLKETLNVKCISQMFGVAKNQNNLNQNYFYELYSDISIYFLSCTSVTFLLCIMCFYCASCYPTEWVQFLK